MTAGMPDIGALLAQAQQMQQRMMAAQDGLADMRVTGTAGGGLVAATVDGHGDLLTLTIAPDAYDASDPDALETLADLVVAAVRDARTEAERQAADQLSAASDGLADLGGSLGGLLGGTGDSATGTVGGLESLLPPGLLGPLAEAAGQEEQPGDDAPPRSAGG